MAGASTIDELRFDQSAAPLPRPATPAADAILGRPIHLLDHGFVRLVDYMGDDAAIVQAARVSYGLGTRKASEDQALIRYLLRHRHTTPFEMVDLKLHIKAPLFVARQWLRHRTACLAGDTVLSFDLPGAEKRGKRWHQGMTMQKFHRLWHEGSAPTVSKKQLRDRLGKMHLRMCDEETGEIRHTHVTDIWQSGVKPVFKVTLDTGKTLKMTKDHRCLTDQGWMTLEEATGLRLTNRGGVTWNGNSPAFATNGMPIYQSAEWLAAQTQRGRSVTQMANEAGVSSMTIRSWLRKQGLQRTPSETARRSGQTQPGQRRTLSVKRVFGERDTIGRWATEHAQRVHERNGYRCVICRVNAGLHAHHVDPVWHNPARARDEANLTSLCQRCHTDLHRLNLELALLDAIESDTDLSRFWIEYQTGRERPAVKRLPRTTRLFRHWAKVVHIAYAGEEMTYDLEVAGPFHNFVANNFIVHNSVNELSARYSILPDEMYLPDDTQISFQSTDNRQGRSAVAVDPALKARVRELLLAGQRESYAAYQELLDAGIARELARIALPVSVYTEWYWKINLHNLFHFLELRADPHAQAEIRLYAEAIGLIAQRLAPVAYDAFGDYLRDAVRLSGVERDLVGRALRGVPIGPEDWGRLGKRERAEFASKFDLAPEDLADRPPPPAGALVES